MDDDLKPSTTEYSPQIPWIVRSLLHANGAREITVRQAAALSSAEIDALERLLLHGIVGDQTRSEVRRWTNALRANQTAQVAA